MTGAAGTRGGYAFFSPELAYFQSRLTQTGFRVLVPEQGSEVAISEVLANSNGVTGPTKGVEYHPIEIFEFKIYEP